MTVVNHQEGNEIKRCYSLTQRSNIFGKAYTSFDSESSGTYICLLIGRDKRWRMSHTSNADINQELNVHVFYVTIRDVDKKTSILHL